MSAAAAVRRVVPIAIVVCLAAFSGRAIVTAQNGTELRDPQQTQDAAFARLYKEWTGDAKYGSPLVDHLPLVKGIPTPKDVLGYYVGAPKTLTYYADILRYYRALAAATPRVKVEKIGTSDEGRELVVVWVSSDENMKALDQNRANLARLADPRGLSDERIGQLIAATKPNYHLTGGLHSTETGPSEMLMELVYRLATETSPIITKIRDNVYVSVTPVADADGRDRAVDWFYFGLETADRIAAEAAAVAKSSPPAEGAAGRAAERTGRGAGGRGRGGAGAGQPAGEAASETPEGQSAAQATGQGGRGGTGGIGAVPYWGKYVFHDNNRDINLSLVQMRALTEWYYTAHPPIMHDLHESQPLLYTYSGGPPQNPNLDPLLFAELPWFSNWELAQMTKWGMPGVYTFAFMDGWSPGYYASVAYNHNGLMKMYETQSGRDPGTPTAGRGGRGGESAPAGEGGRGQAPAEGGRGTGRGRASALPTGRGGAQDREWYRGIPVPPNAAASFTRRANTNYMETAILSSLQLTSEFPSTVVENFYIKTRNALEDGRTKPPYGFVIPVQRDMTRAAELVRILRLQGIEVGRATGEVKIGEATYPPGSYIIKRDQPYGRLAKNLLEKQVYPDTRLMTYDDSGWTMGLLMRVDVKEIADAAILKVPTAPVTDVRVTGTVTGAGSAGLAVAHYGSNNMIAFRYRLASTPMRIAEAAFTAGGIEFPAGSFVIDGPVSPSVRAAVEELGLTAAALTDRPKVGMHESKVPRVAIFSLWTTTQDLGWYRLTFDRFGIPYDLIYKEQVRQGGLRDKYDVIIMAAQNVNRQTTFQPPAARPQPYQKSEKYQFLGMYGETADMSGGMGQEGVDAFAAFLEGGGTLIAAGNAARFPMEFGWAHTLDPEPITGVVAQRPIVQMEIQRPEHPVFYGYTEKTLPIKYVGGVTLRVGVADQGNALARYVGGDDSVLSGAMTGADVLRQRVIAADIPRACDGKGRVILFANNPIYRWQNHGEFNLVFNAVLNWSYVPPPAAAPAPTGRGGRGGFEQRAGQAR